MRVALNDARWNNIPTCSDFEAMFADACILREISFFNAVDVKRVISPSVLRRARRMSSSDVCLWDNVERDKRCYIPSVGT